MPPKKAKLTQEEEDQLVGRVFEKITEQFDDKFSSFEQNFSRMEQAIKDLAAASKVARVAPPVTRARKRAAESQLDNMSTEQQQAFDQTNNVNSHSTSATNASLSNRQYQAERLDAPDVTQRPKLQLPTLQATSARQQTANDFDIELLLNNAGPRSNNNLWADWLHNSNNANLFSTVSAAHNPPPASDEADLKAQVQQIIENMVHTLSACTSEPGSFPFKYIARGPERRKAMINSLTLSEHLLGILHMVTDRSYC